MRSRSWQFQVAFALIAISALLYLVRWYLFPGFAARNEMWRFFLGDIAFLFVQVVLVTLVLDGMLRRRQREDMLTKLNMIIGAFFSEAGTDLLGQIARADSRLPEVRDDLVPTMSWTPADYDQSKQAFAAHRPKIDLSSCDLERLRDSLTAERSFLIGLIGNQNLLEHETFTDLLWALTHLGEELTARTDLSQLSTPDAIHIAGDVKRAYTLLGTEWLAYLRHLQVQYPYLFSLAVRTNPLDPQATVEVAEQT